MRFFYNLSVWGYYFLVKIASLQNEKAKHWIAGRKEVWNKLSTFQAASETFWFHCASLGEFEQARPLIEQLKIEYPDSKIVITFFSPSGYAIRKDYELADEVVYLPLDTSKNAKQFYDLVQPTKVFFVKYEFWAHFILTAKERKIPIYLVSAVFREKQVFFKWYGGFMRKVLTTFNSVFVQNQESQELLKSISIDSVLAGDTRYDRTLANAKKLKSFPIIESFSAQSKVLVCGSVWKEDLEIIAPILDAMQEVKLIIAPHNVDEQTIALIEKAFKQKSTIRYSKVDQLADEQILIIDNIGMLMHLYQYGCLAYVGGAFKTGLHNILEPASFGLPIIFGPKTQKFPEAKLFVENNCAIQISTSQEFSDACSKLLVQDRKEQVLSFMFTQAGATEKILSQI